MRDAVFPSGVLKVQDQPSPVTSILSWGCLEVHCLQPGEHQWGKPRQIRTSAFLSTIANKQLVCIFYLKNDQCCLISQPSQTGLTCACSVAKFCLTLSNPVDCSLPGSSRILGILSARILEWAAMPSSRGSQNVLKIPQTKFTCYTKAILEIKIHEKD